MIQNFIYNNISVFYEILILKTKTETLKKLNPSHQGIQCNYEKNMSKFQLIYLEWMEIKFGYKNQVKSLRNPGQSLHILCIQVAIFHK